MKRIGFTLVELLVVIAVIAVLLAVIAPTLHAVKQSAMKVTCGSNLKQLYFSLSIYNQNYRTLPHGFNDAVNYSNPPDVYLGNTSYDKLGLWWIQVISDDVNRDRQKTEVWCPANSFKHSRLEANVLCGNYGINRSICKDSGGLTGTVGSEFIGDPLNMDLIRNSSETLLIMDSGYSIISWNAASNAAPPLFDNQLREDAFYIPGMTNNTNRTFSDEFTNDAIKGRHRNQTNNVVFVDGHLEHAEADFFFVESNNKDDANQSPLWIPR